MGYQDLAYGIVKQAVEDYRETRVNGQSTKPIEKFFKSEWCAFLLASSKLTGDVILAHLESETR